MDEGRLMLGGVKSDLAFRHSFQARPLPRFFY
jgi:hypothetical protein